MVLRLVLGKGQVQPLGSRGSRYEEGLHLIRSRGSYTRDFLGKGRGFKGMSEGLPRHRSRVSRTSHQF